MDIVLGVSMTLPTVRMVLLEGENGDGVTVDEDEFTVDAGAESQTVAVATNWVVSAILGTRESARRGGHRLASTGVTYADQAQAAVLRDALAARRVDNVVLVSAFLAGAALAQAVGGAIGYARTALLFLQPDAATVAVIDSSDGSISEAHRQRLTGDDDAALAELTALVAGIDRLESGPAGIFVVGSGVNVAMIKPRLEAATSLTVSTSEEPETALARGAALASAHAPLFVSSTRAVAWARDPGTGEVDKNLISRQYAYVPPGADDVVQGESPLAYSGVDDGEDTSLLEVTGQRRVPLLLAASALATLFVVGVVALVIALAVDIRPGAGLRPNAGGNVVVPAQPEPLSAPMAPPAPPPSAPPTLPPSAPPAPAPSAPPIPTPNVVVPKPVPQQPVHRQPAYTPPPAAPAQPPAPPPAAPPPEPPPPPPPPPLPTMAPMTMWLHLPFLSIPIPINPPPPPPPPP